MISICALLAVAMRGQAAKIDFSCRAETMAHLVVDLSKATGRKFSVATLCANDVLLIDVHGVSADSLLAEIAKVDAGMWMQTADGTQFVPDRNARRAEEKDEFQRRVQTIRAAVRAHLASLSDKGKTPSNGGAAQSQDDRAQGEPRKVRNQVDLAITNLVNGLDPASLVLEPTQRVVFSTRPTSVQAELGQDASSILSEFLQARNAEIASATSGDTPRPVDGAPVTDYSKADLIVTSFDRKSLYGELYLFDNAGAQLYDSGMVGIGNDSNDDTAAPESAAQNTVSRQIIAYSDAATAFRKVYRSQRSPSSPFVPVPAAVIPFLRDPEHHDPLALSASDELLAFAHARQKPLVAAIPDSDFSDAVAFFDNNEPIPTLQDFIHDLKHGDTLTLNDSGNWLEIKPVYPASERDSRTDRSALGRFMRQCLQSAFPNLEQFADFARDMPDIQNRVLAGYLTTIVAGYGNAGLGTIPNWNLYRLYGHFTPDQRQTLLAGGKLPLTALSAVQSSILATLTYGQDNKVTFGIGPADPHPGFPTAFAAEAVTEHDAVGYENEPTELLPNGIQSSGWLEMKGVGEPFVSPCGQPDQGLDLLRMLGVGQMAKREVNLSRARTPRNQDAIKFDLYRLGTRTVNTMAIHLSKDAFIMGRLYDIRFDKGSQELAIDDLPKDWLDEYQRRVANLQKAQAANPDQGAGAPPPRPR